VSGATRVYIEVGGKRAFASAADWPGWSRSGKDESSALEALTAYAGRYAKVAKLAHIDFPKDAIDLKVVDRLKGNATTDFGAPGIVAREEKAATSREIDRLIALMEAAWKYLDQVKGKAPQELRKGPRGGGRDRDKMFAHVLDAELAYASALRVKLKAPDRKTIVAALRDPDPEARWPPAYAIRRIAWHALDHAWEMEDRIP
jgi:hypothetical protein